MTHADYIKNNLQNAISSVVAVAEKYVCQPGKDFSRKRKLDLETFTHLILHMQGNTIASELERFFNYALSTPTKSAFVQQRKKNLL